jgi:protocatechuate 3,4-dioxygenase alpha subunit
MRQRQTPSQTVGPYFAYGLVPAAYGYPHASIAGSALANDETTGERIRIEGRILDGQGEAIGDALVEIWQANADGHYAHPADPRGAASTFKGFGRCGTGTDPERRFAFETVKPGSVDGRQAPHINVILTMRGLLVHVFTRIYFSDEGAANASDPVLQSVPEERRGTLVAERVREREGGAGAVYRFDIHMQGSSETVFFDA